jgi:exopolysaccharide production protein ExoZ
MLRQMGKAAPDVPVVQYLRGIAATMVIVAHSADQIGSAASVVSNVGTAGVDIFFVISGFIMTYTTAMRSYSRAGFIWRRIVRIVPIYWAVTCLAAVTVTIVPFLFKDTVFTWPEFLTSLFFIPLQNPAVDDIAPLLKLGWTLNYEMFFYLLFCAFLPWRTSVRIVAIGAVFGVAYWLAPTHWAPFVFYGRPITFEFILGSFAGWLFVSGLLLPRPLGIAGVVVSLWFFVWGASFAPQNLLYCGVPAAGIVISLLTLQRGMTRINKLLHTVGDASYSIYCTHLFLVMAIAKLWRTGLGMASPLGDAVYVAICVWVAAWIGILSYRHFEMPLIARLRSMQLPQPVGMPAE